MGLATTDLADKSQGHANHGLWLTRVKDMLTQQGILNSLDYLQRMMYLVTHMQIGW
jgi:hypothetical protein